MDVHEWLLDSDPAVRWQVMRDLTDASPAEVDVERARVATEGWGAQLLSMQQANGGWSRVAEPKQFIESADGSATHALALLVDMGLDPESEPARRAVDLVADQVRFYEGNQPFFTGETEACINGRVLLAGAYFGRSDAALAQRLVNERLQDGGWNCDAPASSRGSFHSTICVLEGLLSYEHTVGGGGGVTEARTRGQDYLLDRRLARSLSTGELINPNWSLFSYPPGHHYDLLRGLDYLRKAGVAPDDRAAEAVELVKGKQTAEGRWLLENPHRDLADFHMEAAGEPSHWNTLRALRVLKWAGSAVEG